MRKVVCDIETNSVDLNVVNRIHVVGYQFVDEDEVKVITDPKQMKRFFEQGYTIIGHNFIKYDAPVINKILGVDIPVENIIDTLGISFYLRPKSQKHGLGFHGERLGISKVKVEDEQWESDDIDLMRERVSEDCKINIALWKEQEAYLNDLYEGDEEAINRVIGYLNFKLYQVRIQEEEGVMLDLKKVEENIAFLNKIISEKTEALEAVMPPLPIIKKKVKPKRFINKKGELTKLGQEWVDFLKEREVPEDYEGTVEFQDGEEAPSASSPVQVKKWLFSLGWKPRIFKDGANGKVPQLRNDDKELCDSVLELIEKEPAVEYLEGLSTASHRKNTYLLPFKETINEEGYVKASASSFTKTLRLKHVKPMVNLVKPDKPYGSLVRSCIVAPPGMLIVGADISSLEDQMKKIHIYKYDPEYVEKMNLPGWDAHLFLGELSGMMSKEECDYYRWWESGDKDKLPKGFSKEDFVKIKEKRAVCKTANYALVYGCGIPRLMETTKLKRKEAQALYDAYWKMNKSVKDFSADRVLKHVGEDMWVWNETAKMWGFLTAEKDIFSSCNSMGGVKVFDTWLYFCIKAGLRPIFSYHDEQGLYCKPEEYESVERILRDSMRKVNKAFNFPIEIEIDVKKGTSYDKVH